VWHFAHSIAKLRGTLTMATPGKFNSFDISHLSLMGQKRESRPGARCVPPRGFGS
jgi:hypothetical protein